MTNYMGINRLKKIAKHTMQTYTGADKKLQISWGSYRFYRGNEWLGFCQYDARLDHYIEGEVYVRSGGKYSRVKVTLDSVIENENTGDIKKEELLRNITIYTSDFKPVVQPSSTYLYDEQYHVQDIAKSKTVGVSDGQVIQRDEKDRQDMEAELGERSC